MTSKKSKYDDLAYLGGGITEIGAKKLMKKFPLALKEMGIKDIDNLKSIGSGTRGVAFDIGDKVLKITTDKSEAEASNEILNMHSEYLTYYYDVFEFENTNVFGIVQEKLYEISNNEKNMFDDAIEYLDFSSILEYNDANIDDTINHYNNIIKDEKDDQKKKKLVYHLNILFDYFQIENFISSLNDLSIYYFDYHSENIMKRKNGNYILIDLGYSEMTPNKTIKNIKESKKLYMTVDSLKHIIREASDNSGSGVNDEKAKELMKKFPIGMKRMGVSPQTIDSLQSIGEGTRGIAYAVGDKVLKITNDETEAKTSNMLIGVNNPNLTKYYNVWRFGDSDVYGILQEKLNPLPESDGVLFNKALVATGLPVFIRNADYDFDKAKELSKKYVKNKIEKAFKTNELSKDEALEQYKNMNEYWNLLSNKYNMRGLCELLGKLGIKFRDYHAGNIMIRDDGQLVLIDLGHSKLDAGASGSKKPILSIKETIGRFKTFIKILTN